MNEGRTKRKPGRQILRIAEALCNPQGPPAYPGSTPFAFGWIRWHAGGSHQNRESQAPLGSGFEET